MEVRVNWMGIMVGVDIFFSGETMWLELLVSTLYTRSSLSTVLLIGIVCIVARATSPRTAVATIATAAIVGVVIMEINLFNLIPFRLDEGGSGRQECLDFLNVLLNCEMAGWESYVKFDI